MVNLPILPIRIRSTPETVIEYWPRHRPLAAWGIGPKSEWSRWAIVAEPDLTQTIWVACDDREGALKALEGLGRRSADVPARESNLPPFVGGWIGSLAYGLGKLLEPKAAWEDSPVEDRRWPSILMQRCPGAWCYDKLTRQWYAVGTLAAGGEGGSVALPPVEVKRRTMSMGTPALSNTGKKGYQEGVEHVLEYIRAGDVYQVNLAHRLEATFAGAMRPNFLTLVEKAKPWYGAYLADDHRGVRRLIASVSPELFFALDAGSRRIVTRPMKGTRPMGKGEELAGSSKDRAELAMIVDLMRNDLGRVCELGSVQVDQERAIEAHGAVVQGVSSVSGKVRADAKFADVVGALFPGGSVTGTPKIRAMQIIEELEPEARGPYCGALGYVSDCGNAAFSMAIRTLAVTGLPPMDAEFSIAPVGLSEMLREEFEGTPPDMGKLERDLAKEKQLPSPTSPGLDEFEECKVDYWIGAGIVADSTPQAEWEETRVKAAPLLGLFLDPERGVE
ncbi:MAG: anthranilate synthase component I family protein [Planctomycetota bacterium]